MHICHVFSVVDHINFSSYCDDDPVHAPIDVKRLLLMDDDKLKVKDAVTLFLRYEN